MSLQVWLPLTKDLRNQGLSDVTVTNYGATLDNNGKLGKCYYFDGTDDAIGIGDLNNICPDGNFSFACWFYKSEFSSKGYDTIFGGPSGFELETKNGTTNSNVIVPWNWGKPQIAYEFDKWYHLVMTRTSSGTTYYLNGEQVATGTAGTIPAGNYFIGAWNTATQQNYKGKLNDVRIYDHCLSPMEVKRISQGLVLHYPLNRMGFGQENLMLNSNEGWHSTGYNVMQGYLSEPWVIGDTYTVQVKGTPTPGKQFGIWADKGATIFSWFSNINGIWVATFTVRQYDYQYPTNFAIYDYNSSGSHDATIEWIKVEKGSIPTPWCPNSADDLATQMGLNSNIEYDTSGYCNNGTRTGTFDWISDTPKYEVSTKFNGTNSATTSPIFDSTIRHSELTIATWIKRTSDDANYHYYLSSSGVSAGIRSYNSVNNYYLISWNHATDSSSSVNSWVNTVMPLNTWVHSVWIFSHGIMKHYINGELKGTSDRSATGTYILGDICSIIGTGYSTSSNWEGGLSDLRIYTTALSADDVKSLYQNTATIDADGTIHGAVR